MRVLDRFRRAPPPPPPPYTLADPGQPTHAELAQSLVAPWPRPPPSSALARHSGGGAEGVRRQAGGGLARVPLGVLHRICELALAVPRSWDEDADAARAVWDLYALRRVDRRFYIGVSAVSG